MSDTITKEQALYNFWSSFGVKAYEETSVPEKTAFPYITYQTTLDSFGAEVAMTASVWDRKSDWSSVTDIKDSISAELTLGGKIIHYTGGAMWLKKAQPFAQRMGDADKSIRRIVLNVSAEFISAD